MPFKKSIISSAVVSTLTMIVTPPALAVPIVDGNYLAVINTTPVVNNQSSWVYDTGSDGAWNSSLFIGSYNAPPSDRNYGGMTDNSVTISTPSGTRGSSMIGNGAGSFNISLSGGSFTASGFQADAIFGLPVGTFVQYGTIAGGTVTGTGGMTLDVTGRMGAASFVPSSGSLHDERWNVNDFNSGAGGGTTSSPDIPCTLFGCTGNGATAYTVFTTGPVMNYATQGNSTNPGAHTSGLGFLNTNSITGAEAVALGDINSDGLTDYRIILVSASHMGFDWGNFFGASYLETWNINLLSQAAVPIPATAWLFGSGVLGLAAVARRKKKP